MPSETHIKHLPVHIYNPQVNKQGQSDKII